MSSPSVTVPVLAIAPVARRPGRTPTSAAIVVAVAFALLTAACGGSPGSHVARVGSTTTQSNSSANSSAASAQQDGAVAYAGCMRSNGVPRWPDPNSNGVFDKSKLTSQQLGAGTSQLQAAQSACRQLLPNGGNGPSPARVQQIKAQGLQFSQCVRSHGVPNFPDPGNDGRIPDPATAGINQGSPKFEAANQACRKYRPPYIPSNAAYNAYARTHG
jgi:hypothetical protein